VSLRNNLRIIMVLAFATPALGRPADTLADQERSPALRPGAAGSTFFVNRNHAQADDGNPGSEALPWRTIQHAADVANPGDTIIVRAGTYDERVELNRAGAAENKITFIASPRRTVLMKGFIARKGYVRLEGFRITGSETGGWEKLGIMIYGDGVEVVDNELFDIPHVAIGTFWEKPYPQHGYVARNRIYRSQLGIVVNGDHWIIEDNEVERLIFYGSGDADYSRFFGEDIVIRRNYFHGTSLAEIGAAHVDCYQTFDNNGEYARNVLIEGNVCLNFHQGLMANANFYHNSSNIRLQNNVFAHGWAWGIAVHDIPFVTVANNTFVDIQYHGVGFRDASHDNLVVNNIFFRTGTSYWASDGATLSGDHNLIFESRDPPTIGSHDILGKDPQFAGLANDDFRLLSASPAIDAGTPVSGVDLDLLGVARPQGIGFDIGAYEATGSDATFVDVPVDHPYHDDIEILYRSGFTSGCAVNPLRFCPDDPMTRAESAVFLERGQHGANYAPPDPTAPHFVDTPVEAWYTKWIEGLWVDGYTVGCALNPPRFCPEQTHNRVEGAVFALRMKNGPSYEPPAAQGMFADLPAIEWGARWAEAAVQAGLLTACAEQPLRYCPADPVTRGLAAHIVVQAKGLRP